MGFDLYGLKPATADNGKYFRESVWGWRPLWELVCNVSADILTPKDCEMGSYNDSHKIIKSKAMKIATRLEKHLESGFIDKYIEDRDTEIDSMPLEECDLCNGTGWRRRPPVRGRGDTVALREWAFTEEIAEKELINAPIPEGIDCMLCNACQGKGETSSFSTHYHLSKESVKEFVEFCKFSGGFSIC